MNNPIYGASAKVIVCLLVAFALTACVNGYTQFYQPLPGAGSLEIAPLSVAPRLVGGDSDPRQATLNMYQNGYALIGVANFVGPAANPAGAIAQARKVGAAFVVVSQEYQNTVSGSLPITMPTTSTSYSSGTVSAFGTGGFATGNYSGTTTTSGSQTTYVPYSVDRYTHSALFFAPLQRRGIGIYFNPLTPEQRQQAGTNQAVQVAAVRNGSPAFVADILPGDLIESIGGRNVFDAASVGQAISQATGQSADIVMLRNGMQLTKVVTIPSGEWGAASTRQRPTTPATNDTDRGVAQRGQPPANTEGPSALFRNVYEAASAGRCNEAKQIAQSGGDLELAAQVARICTPR